MSKEYAKDDDFWLFQVKFKFIFNKLYGLKGKSLFINKLKCKWYQLEKNNGEQKTLEL